MNNRVSDSHDSNELDLIWWIPSINVINWRFLQPSKASLLIVCIEDVRWIDWSEKQPLKQCEGILVIPSGMFIWVSEEQLEKQPL
jgi:hypothetical protein